MQKEMVTIEKLVKKFGDFTALNGIDLTVRKGEIFGILGPNGAGKTTTINTILTLLKPTSGRVFVDGFNVLNHPEVTKQKIGFLTQETVVEGDLTARENLVLFSELYHIPKAQIDSKVADALDEAELTVFADKKASTFSGGMQRRLALVRAMIQQPELLMLDEPTTGLDVQNRTSMWKRIRDLNKKGVTIILTTQYLEEANELCDRLAIVDHGRVIALGTPSEIKRIIGENVLEILVKLGDAQKVASILKAKFGITATANGERVRAMMMNRKGLLARISETLDTEEIPVLAISLHLPTLDDVFIKLTGGGLRDAIDKNSNTATRAGMMFSWKR